VLVDVDGAALQATAAACLEDAGLASRVELVTADVTGLGRDFPRRVRGVLARHQASGSAAQAVADLLGSFCFEAPPRWAPPVDVVYSGMVLSQLAQPLTAYVERAFAARFPGAPEARAPFLRRALAAFTRAVQHAHVASLVETAPAFVLTSDVSERATLRGPDGLTNDVSPEVPLLGVERLDELLPARRARPVAAAEWHWRRLLSTRGRRGSTLRVQGVVAKVAAATTSA